MNRPPSDAIRADVSVVLARDIEAAIAGIARLDARVSASLVRQPWSLRAAWSGYTRALQLQGIEIDEIDVFSWGCGLVLPSRPLRTSHRQEFAAFASWVTTLDGRDGMIWRDRLPMPLRARNELPLMLHALAIVHDFARIDATATPWLALPGIVQGVGASETILPCLVGGAKAMRLRVNPPNEVLCSILRSLGNAADANLDRLRAMEDDHRRALRVVANEYRPGALLRLASLIALRPILSPRSVAEYLDLTLAGAGKLLSRAAELGLLIEVSGRKTWRLYLPPDLAMSFGFIARPRGRPAKAPPPPPFERSLAAMLDTFDREMIEINRRLNGLGITTDV